MASSGSQRDIFSTLQPPPQASGGRHSRHVSQGGYTTRVITTSQSLRGLDHGYGAGRLMNTMGAGDIASVSAHDGTQYSAYDGTARAAGESPYPQEWRQEQDHVELADQPFDVTQVNTGV